jgi:hypothetical protein
MSRSRTILATVLVTTSLGTAVSLPGARHHAAVPPAQAAHVPGATVGPSVTGPLRPTTGVAEAIQDLPADNVTLAGQVGGTLFAVTVSGARSYLGVGPRVVVYDVSDPRDPREVGRTPVLGDTVYGVAVQGERLFAAAGEAGLVIVDVGDPVAPVVVGEASVPDGALAVCASGSHAYVGTGMGDLRILDVSDPGQPDTVAVVAGAGNTFRGDVFEDGGHVYQADPRGLRVVDVRDPSLPREMSMVTDLDGTPVGEVTSVFVAAGRAYVAGRSGVHILDVTDPSSPRPLATGIAPGGSMFRSVHATSGRLYLADSEGMRVFDVDDPAHPRQVGSIPRAPGIFDTKDLYVANGHAHVVSDDGMYQVVDVSDAANPTVVAQVTFPGHVWRVHMSGHHAYVPASDRGLYIYDVSDPYAPRLDGWVPDSTGAVFVDGGRAYSIGYLGTSAQLRIHDVTDPTRPVLLATFDAGALLSDVYAADGLVYLVTRDALYVVNARRPDAPVRIGSVALAGEGRDVDVQAGLAFVAEGMQGVTIVNVTNPAAPRVVAHFRPGDTMMAYRLFAAGAMFYVADFASGVRIVDASDPARPRQVGRIGTPRIAARGVAVDGTNLFLADQHFGMRAYDISEPAAPREIGYTFTPGLREDVSAGANVIAFADTYGGVDFMHLGPPIPPTPTRTPTAPPPKPTATATVTRTPTATLAPPAGLIYLPVAWQH